VLEVLEELLRDMTVEVVVVPVVPVQGQMRMVPVQGGMVVTVLLPATTAVIVDRMVEGRGFLVVLVVVVAPGRTHPRPVPPAARRLEGVAQHTVRPWVDAMVDKTGLKELVL